MTDPIHWTQARKRLGDLSPWPRNPRQIKLPQAKRLLESVQQFGQVETLAVGPDNEVFNGHQRLNVLLERYGPDYEVDVRVSSRPLSEKEREKLTVYLHKGAAGEWDFDTLANEFDVDELIEWGFEAGELGIDLTGEGDDAEPQIDRAEELRAQWGVELGQTWQIGNHTLYCGDSAQWPLEHPDGILTDPPYDLDAGKVIGIFNGIAKAAMVLTSDAQMVALAALWPLRINLVWHHRRPNSYPTDHMPVINHSQCSLITQDNKVKHGWKRPSPGFSSIISVEREYEAQNDHYGKGADIFVELLRGFPWQVVGDPFLGTGATVIACERLGRQCIGAEIDPATFAVALQRVSDALGAEPQLC